MLTRFSPRFFRPSLLAAAVCTALVLPAMAQVMAQLPRGGRMLPDVPIKTGNATLDLKQYRGKSLLIGLVSTQCLHCIVAMDTFKQLQTRLGPSGFQVVVAVGDPIPVADVSEFSARMKANFPVGYLNQPEFIKMAAIKPGVRPFVPIVMFVDRTGVVRAQYFGDDPKMKDAATTIRQTAEQLVNGDRQATAKAAPKE